MTAQPLPNGIALAALECIRQAYEPGTMAHDTAHKALVDTEAARAAAPETTPGQAAKSCVSVEATQLNETETGWVEAGIFIDRAGEDELAQQMLLASPDELRAVYDGLKLHYEQGIWSFRTVERSALAAQEQPAPGACPGCESLRRQCSEIAGEAGILAGALREIQDAHETGTCAHDTAHAALDALHGLRPQPAPATGNDWLSTFPSRHVDDPVTATELDVAAVIAERNQLRWALKRLADDGNLLAAEKLAAIGEARVTEARPAPDLSALAELSAEMHTAADRCGGSLTAVALHGYASRIRLALGPDVTREALEGE